VIGNIDGVWPCLTRLTVADIVFASAIAFLP
jgi:hypothetical protein